MPEPTAEEIELLDRIRWFIKMRYLAASGVFLVALSANFLFHLHFYYLPIYIMAGVIVLYNAIFSFYARRIKISQAEIEVKKVSRLANLQISADLIALTILIHYTGGIENPFIFYFIFHMIISSILLSTRASYRQATLAVILLGAMVALEYTGVIKHWHLFQFTKTCEFKNPYYITGVFFVFATTIYASVYMATSITRRLRKRQKEVVDLKDNLEQKTKELEEINKKLTKLDALRTRFLVIASHDLKAPLTAVDSYLEVMLGGFTGEINEKQKNMLERSIERVKELLDLINSLLDLSHIESGKIVHEMSMVNLDDVLENSLENVQALAQEKEIKVEVSKPEKLPQLYAAGARIQQTLTNLLNNAIKFTPKKGKIKLLVNENQKFVQIEVIDNGIGIPQDELPKIFDEFYQCSNIEIKERKGAGLGLSIAKQVVKFHQGKIWVESDTGKGSKFSFTLPKTKKRGGISEY